MNSETKIHKSSIIDKQNDRKLSPHITKVKTKQNNNKQTDIFTGIEKQKRNHTPTSRIEIHKRVAGEQPSKKRVPLTLP